MNKSLILIGALLLGAGASAQTSSSNADSANPAEVFAQRIREADRADVPYWNGKPARIPTGYLAVTDHQWIGRFADALGSTFLVPCSHLLEITPDLIFRDKIGAALIRVQCMGRIICIDDGADYQMDAKTASELRALLKEKAPN